MHTTEARAMRTQRPAGVRGPLRLVIAAATLMMLGCGDDAADGGAVPLCVPGKVEPCPCGDEPTGTQVCAEDGRFGSCQCPAGGTDATGGSDGGGGADAPGGSDAGGGDVGGDVGGGTGDLDTGGGAGGDTGGATGSGPVFASRGIGGGGALYSVTLSPHDVQEIALATDMGASFRSSDYGASFQTFDFEVLAGGVDTELRYTSDPAVLFGIHVRGDDARVPVRSGDGGASFAPIDDPTSGEAYALDADPDATTRVLLTSWSNLYFSSDGGGSFAPAYAGKSQDAGLVLAGVVWDGARIIVGTNDGLVVSEDGGATFAAHPTTGLPTGGVILRMAGAVEGGSTRLFAVVYDAGSVWNGISGAENWDYLGIYRLDWGDDAWLEVPGTIPTGAHPFFIGMARGDVDVVYAAGGDVDTSFPVVLRSGDGGASWKPVFDVVDNGNIETGWAGFEGDVHWWWPETALGFGVSPVDSSRAVITDYGFAHVTSDGGVSWQAAYVHPDDRNPAGKPTPQGQSYRGNGLEDTSSWWLHWTGTGTLLAAFTDVAGLRSADGGQRFQAGFALGLPHNSTYCIVEQPGTGRVFAATSSVHDVYESRYLDSSADTGEGAVVVSTDDGASFQTFYDFGAPVVWLALDPGHEARLYASVVGKGIFVSDDIDAPAPSFEELTAPPRTAGHPFAVIALDDGTLVATYSGRRDDVSGDFTETSGVFVSSDGGGIWEDRSDPGMLRWTKDLVLDPHDAAQSTFYVAVFSHWGAPPNEVGGVYRTTDRGLSWTRVIDSYRVESLTFDPTTAGRAFFSTEAEGLWLATGLDGSSPTSARVPGYPFRHPTRMFWHPEHPGELWVTSFGGGLFVGTPGAQ